MKKLILIQILFTSVFLTSCGVGSVDCGGNAAGFGLAFCDAKKPNKWDNYVGTFTQCRPIWETGGNNRPGLQEYKEVSKESILLKYVYVLNGDNKVNEYFTANIFESNNCSGTPFATAKISSPILLTYKNSSITPVILNTDITAKIQNLTIDFATESIPKSTASISGPKLINGCYNSVDTTGAIQNSICEATTTIEASNGEVAFYLTGKNLFPLSYVDSVWQSEPYNSGFIKQ